MDITRTPRSVAKMVGATRPYGATVMAIFQSYDHSVADVQFGEGEPTSQLIGSDDARDLAEFFKELAKELEKA